MLKYFRAEIWTPFPTDRDREKVSENVIDRDKQSSKVISCVSKVPEMDSRSYIGFLNKNKRCLTHECWIVLEFSVAC